MYFLPCPTVVLIGTFLLHNLQSTSSQASAFRTAKDENGAPYMSDVTSSGLRFTITHTPITLPPAFLTLLTTFNTEPPVVVRSSTIKTFFPFINLSYPLVNI